MPSLISGYNYDIFISYRQKDNKGERWVSEFVETLKTELDSTFKEEICVYFDINPHDGLLETHDVSASLKEKLKCLIFIPIISRTYCDPKSFAWEHEFKAFLDQASHDQYGLMVKLPNGNVASRVLPVRIHDLDKNDIILCESELGGVLRGVEFIYKEAGVNRSLSSKDSEEKNLNKTNYRNQINKVALAIKEIISGLIMEHPIPGNLNTLATDQFDETKKERRKTGFKVPVKFTRTKLLAATLTSALLLTLVIILPGIIKGRNNLDSSTTVISFINESGQKESRRVFKNDFITKLMVFPFTNETPDSSDNWLQYGIFDALTEDLIQFNYLELGEYSNTFHIQEQINIARSKNYPWFLTGAFKVTDGNYVINSRLHKTSNGSVVSERVFKGSDLFCLIDSISLSTRIDLGIPEHILSSSSDLPLKETMTNNPEAFRVYVNGAYNTELNYPSVNQGIHIAISLDSTFALALYNSSYYNHLFELSKESVSRDINQAMRHRQRLSEFREISTRILYYSILGETDKAITLSENLCKLQPNNINLLLILIEAYHNNFIIDKLTEAVIKLNKLVPDQPEYQLLLARCHLYSGNYDKGLEVLNNMLRINPENVDVLFQLGELYIHKNDLEAAEEVIERAKLFEPEKVKAGNVLLKHIAYARDNPAEAGFLKPLSGNYRYEFSEQNLTCFINNQHFIIKGSNQVPRYAYPVSDSQFISTVNNTYTFTFVKDNKGNVVNISYITGASNTPRILFKEDSLVLRARNLLNNGNLSEALISFHEAYEQNPEHYYLANFIKHLEFIQSQKYENFKHVSDSYTGNFGDLKIYKEHDQFYYMDASGLIYKILPLSDREFMIPGMYNKQIQMIIEKNSIKGLRFMYRDGKEEWFPRIIPPS